MHWTSLRPSLTSVAASIVEMDEERRAAPLRVRRACRREAFVNADGDGWGSDAGSPTWS